MNRIRSRKSTSGGASPGSTWAVKASPSSTPYIACSTWPCGESTSAIVRPAGLERLEVLGGQRVQPGEPVGPADPDDAAVGEVDEAVTASERALLAVERAVVRRHGGVDAVTGDGAGETEQRAGDRHDAIVADGW